MPRASAIRIAIPVPPSDRPPADQHTTASTGRSSVNPSTAAFRACSLRTAGEHRSHAGCRAPRSRCRPIAQSPTATGSPAHDARYSLATAARSFVAAPALPLQTRCRPRPPRRSRESSRSAPAIPPSPSYRAARRLESPAPRSRHIAVSPCPDLPGCDCRRSLFVSGFAPGLLLSTSAPARFPTRLIYRRAGCIATAWKSGVGCAARVLAARAALAAGRGRSTGGGAVHAERRAAGRSAFLAGGADRSRIAGPGCALRVAAGARLSPALAPGLPARRLVGRSRAGRAYGGGVGARGAARSGGARRLCGDIQPSGLAGWWWLAHNG